MFLTTSITLNVSVIICESLQKINSILNKLTIRKKVTWFQDTLVFQAVQEVKKKNIEYLK